MDLNVRSDTEPDEDDEQQRLEDMCKTIEHYLVSDVHRIVPESRDALLKWRLPCMMSWFPQYATVENMRRTFIRNATHWLDAVYDARKQNRKFVRQLETCMKSTGKHLSHLRSWVEKRVAKLQQDADADIRIGTKQLKDMAGVVRAMGDMGGMAAEDNREDDEDAAADEDDEDKESNSESRAAEQAKPSVQTTVALTKSFQQAAVLRQAKERLRRLGRKGRTAKQGVSAHKLLQIYSDLKLETDRMYETFRNHDVWKVEFERRCMKLETQRAHREDREDTDDVYYAYEDVENYRSGPSYQQGVMDALIPWERQIGQAIKHCYALRMRRAIEECDTLMGIDKTIHPDHALEITEHASMFRPFLLFLNNATQSGDAYTEAEEDDEDTFSDDDSKASRRKREPKTHTRRSDGGNTAGDTVGAEDDDADNLVRREERVAAVLSRCEQSVPVWSSTNLIRDMLLVLPEHNSIREKVRNWLDDYKLSATPSEPPGLDIFDVLDLEESYDDQQRKKDSHSLLLWIQHRYPSTFRIVVRYVFVYVFLDIMQTHMTVDHTTDEVVMEYPFMASVYYLYHLVHAVFDQNAKHLPKHAVELGVSCTHLWKRLSHTFEDEPGEYPLRVPTSTLPGMIHSSQVLAGWNQKPSYSTEKTFFMDRITKRLKDDTFRKKHVDPEVERWTTAMPDYVENALYTLFPAFYNIEELRNRLRYAYPDMIRKSVDTMIEDTVRIFRSWR